MSSDDLDNKINENSKMSEDIDKLNEIFESNFSYYNSPERDLVLKALEAERQLKGRILYHNLTPLDLGDLDGGPRAVFIADYGLEGKSMQKRVLKLEKLSISSEKARIFRERGCDSLNDFDMLVHFGQDAIKHHISPIYDMWIVKDDDGLDHVIIAEQGYFGLERYKSMMSLLPELKKNPLTKKEFETVSTHSLDALEFSSEKNAYHRDRSLRNLITNIRNKRRIGEGIEAIVTDHANACHKNHTSAKSIATMGAKQITDPLMVPAITGKEKKYDDGAEIYSVARDFLDMLVGEVVIGIDSLTGKVFVSNRFSQGLTNMRKGIFDENEYNLLINNAIASIPSYARKYVPNFRKALSFYENERYSSVSEFIEDWRKKSNRDFAASLNFGLKVAAISAAFMFIGYGLSSFYRPKEIDVFKVHSEWNKETNNVDNNYVDVRVDLWSWKSSETFTNPRAMFVKGGDKVSATITANFEAVAEKYRSYEKFRGQAYIEGVMDTALCEVPVNKFFINAVEPGYVSDMPMAGFYTHLFDLIKIPENAPAGTVYNLVVELYPSADTLVNRIWDSDKQEYNNGTNVLFEGKNNALIRKKIPIVVPEENYNEGAGTKAVLFSSYEHYPRDNVNFTSVSDEEKYAYVNRDLKYIVRIPELGFVVEDNSAPEFGNSKYIRFDLPEGKEKKRLTLQTIVYDDNGVLSQSFTPITGNINRWGPKEENYIYSYELDIPDEDFVNKTMQYSKDADKIVK